MLPFRDFSFLTDEDDVALVASLQEDREKTEPWLVYREGPHGPTPPLAPPLYWDHIPPPALLDQNHLLLLGLSLGLLASTLATLAIRRTLDPRRVAAALAVHGVIILTTQAISILAQAKSLKSQNSHILERHIL